jgi:hypothetical protein
VDERVRLAIYWKKACTVPTSDDLLGAAVRLNINSVDVPEDDSPSSDSGSEGSSDARREGISPIAANGSIATGAQSNHAPNRPRPTPFQDHENTNDGPILSDRSPRDHGLAPDLNNDHGPLVQDSEGLYDVSSDHQPNLKEFQGRDNVPTSSEIGESRRCRGRKETDNIDAHSESTELDFDLDALDGDSLVDLDNVNDREPGEESGSEDYDPVWATSWTGKATTATMTKLLIVLENILGATGLTWIPQSEMKMVRAMQVRDE